MDQFYDVPHYLPGGSAVKNLPAMQETSRRHGFNPWVRKIPGEGNGNLLQYSCLEKSHGWRNLAGYSPWGPKLLDMPEHAAYTHIS